MPTGGMISVMSVRFGSLFHRYFCYGLAICVTASVYGCRLSGSSRTLLSAKLSQLVKIRPLNFKDKGVVNSGFLVMEIESLSEISKVQARFGTVLKWKDAEKDVQWKVSLPNMTEDSYTLSAKDMHDVQIRVLGENQQELYSETYKIRLGINKDFNGDGYADLVVGADGSDIDGANTNRGAVYVYYGRRGGIQKTAGMSGNVNRSPNLIIHYPVSGPNNASFGTSVANVGDLNGDSWADLAVGAPGSTIAGAPKGVVYIYLGSRVGLRETSLGHNQNAVDFTLTYPNEAVNHRFGNTVASAGDVDGDGFFDLIVGAPYSDLSGTDQGAAYLYCGGANGFKGITAGTTQISVPSFIIKYPGTDNNAHFGASLMGLGDTDGDGYGEVAVGAPDGDMTAGDNLGAVYVYKGHVNGITVAQGITSESADSKFVYPLNNQTNVGFGATIAKGDLNGDGFSDLLVGAIRASVPDVTTPNNSRGRVLIYLGSTDGFKMDSPGGTLNSSEDKVDLILNYSPFLDSSAEFGSAISAEGDINGDGFADLAIGARSAMITSGGGSANAGAVFVYQGPKNGVLSDLLANVSVINYPGDPSTANFGTSVSIVGDMNGDGFADLAVGAHNHAMVGGVFLFYGLSSGFSGAAGSGGSPDMTLQYPQSDNGASFGKSID